MDWRAITQKAIDAREPRTATRLAHDIGVSDVAVYYWLNGSEPKGERVLKLIQIADEADKKPALQRRARGGAMIDLLKQIAMSVTAALIMIAVVGSFMKWFEKEALPQLKNAPRVANTVYYVKLWRRLKTYIFDRFVTNRTISYAA